MPDYAAFLDDEVRAYLARTETFYPPDAVDLSIADQRAVYDRMCADFDAGRPEGMGVEDKRIAGVPCRIYAPATPSAGTILYCHGGGFVVGGLDSHDSICAELSAGTGMRLVAVDYRLSPEHPHPADFEDALAVFDALSGDRITLCGDSAGGNLVAAIAHHTRSPRIAGQLLIYPGLGGSRDLPSYITHAEAPGLTVRDMEFYETLRSAGQDKTGDPTYAPLQDSDFTHLPPTVILTAECDPLSSEGEAYAARINAAQGQALWREEQGLVHGYLRARHMSAKAGNSFSRMIQSLSALAKGKLPAFETR